MKKIILIFISCALLGACAQSTALIGPAISVGSTGNIMQAGFAYGTNIAVKQATGKMPSEHVSSYIQEKEKEKKIRAEEEKIRNEMLNYLESHIKVIRKKLSSKSKT